VLHALVVEDDAEIRAVIRRTLEGQNFRVREAESMARGRIELQSRRFDLLLLDLGLPDGDGVTLVREVRKWTEMPIIILSARVGEHDKVQALDAGADDYLTKPFGVAELLARLRAALRRTARAESESPVVSFADVVFDLASRQVTRAGAAVHLTPVEFRLAATLLQHPGKVLTHRQLLARVWGPAHTEDSHYLRIYMQHVRQKLEADPARPKFFITELGIGYRFTGEA